MKDGTGHFFKLLRVMPWVLVFISKPKKEKNLTRSITTREIQKVKLLRMENLYPTETLHKHRSKVKQGKKKNLQNPPN